MLKGGEYPPQFPRYLFGKLTSAEAPEEGGRDVGEFRHYWEKPGSELALRETLGRISFSPLAQFLPTQTMMSRKGHIFGSEPGA